MKQTNYLFSFVCFLLLTVLSTACNETFDNINTQKLPLATRSVYDNEVRWDSTEYLQYRLNTDEILDNLIVPWAQGSTSSIGIPSEWYDPNYLNSNASNRKYSEANGWRLVYTNLLTKGNSNKYLFLYNRYTGILRAFFISLQNISGVSNSIIFALNISGNSSLLNFTLDNPLGIADRQTSPTVYFSPKSQAFGNSSILGFQPNQWYGMDIECAYDPTVNNNLSCAIKSVYTTYTYSSGGITGGITGDIFTTYSGANSFSFSFDNSKKVNITESLGSATSNIKEAIKSGQSGTKKTFWNNLWSIIKEKAPVAANKTVDEGISAILSAGGSYVTKTLGSLAKSIFGVSSGPMTSESKVNLNAKYTLSCESTSTSEWLQFAFSSIPLPGGPTTNELFNEKLGVWNLNATPVVYMDLYVDVKYYAHDTNKTRPLETSGTYKFYLSPSSLMINPALSSELTVSNFKQDMVFVKSSTNYTSTCEEYGVLDDKLLYYTSNPFLQYNDEIIANFNITTIADHYEKYWTTGLNIANNDIYYRVSFDLVSSTDGKTYSFSKYFKPKIVRRNFYPTDIFI